MKTLTQIQKELKAPKNQYNKFGEYKYRNQEDILEAIKPLLDEDDKFYVTDDIVYIGERFYIKATATFNDVSVSAYAREGIERKKMHPEQLTGCASSYARKYALNGLFAIDDTKDADSQDNTQHESITPYNGSKPDGMTSAALKRSFNAIKQELEACTSMEALKAIWLKYKKEISDIKEFDEQYYSVLEDAKEGMKQIIETELK